MSTGIKWGIITGVFLLLWATLFYYLEWHSSFEGRYAGVAGYLFIVLAGVILAGADKRRRSPYLPYMRALEVGFATALIAGALLAGVAVFYYEIINPDFAAEMVLKEKILLQQTQPDMPADKMEEHLTLVRQNFTTFRQALVIFGGTMVWGLICALLAALFLRKK